MDIIGSITLVFFFSVMAIIGWMVLDSIETSAGYTAVGGNVTYLQQGKDAQEVWDWGVLFILFGSMVFALITAYQVDTHPALFAMGIIMLMIALIIAMIISNAFYEFYNTADLATASGAFPNLVYTMNHLVEIMMVFGFILAIVLYGKLRNVGVGNV